MYHIEKAVIRIKNLTSKCCTPRLVRSRQARFFRLLKKPNESEKLVFLVRKASGSFEHILHIMFFYSLFVCFDSIRKNFDSVKEMEVELEETFTSKILEHRKNCEESMMHEVVRFFGVMDELCSLFLRFSNFK